MSKEYLSFREYAAELAPFILQNKYKGQSGIDACEHMAFCYGIYCMGGTLEQCKKFLLSHAFGSDFKLPDQEIIDIAF